MNQIPDRGFTAGEAAFFHQPLVDPAGSVPLLLNPFPVILIQAGRNEVNHIGRHDSRVSAVFLPIPGNGIALPILLNSIAGDTEPLRRCPLACDALQLQTSDLFVNIHRSYHLFFSSYNSVNPIVGHLARWLKYSLSFSGKVAQVDISIYSYPAFHHWKSQLAYH